MRKELKWALAGAVALMLQAGPAAVVEAADAVPSKQVTNAATNDGTQAATDGATQDVINGASEDTTNGTQDTTNGATQDMTNSATQDKTNGDTQDTTSSATQAVIPAVPKECQRSNLSPEAKARCDFIANTPNLCERSDLSKRTQLFCDQQRFAGEPLYNVVRVAANGAVRSLHLIETATGREVYTAYPYGIAFAVKDPRDRELRMKVEDLKSFLNGRPSPAAAEPPAPSGYATGLPIGWNDSTGVASGQCLNYTIATPSNQTERASFTSQDTASSTAEQIKVSATVKGSYEAFSASDSFSYSDQWQSSSNSSNQYYNLFSIYNLNSTVDDNDPLNTQGQSAGDSFDTLCGSQYMASVPVGMVATISINYGSSSESTQTDISDSFKASYGLDSVSAAVNTASSASNSSFYFTFTMVSYGGGIAAANDLNSAFAAENSSGEAYYALCAQGNSDACTQFTSSMGKGATEALDSFNTLVEGLSSASAPDLSFFETFPNGVAGANTTGLVTIDIPTSTSADVLGPFKSALVPYVGLLNQIGTLQNRVGALS